MTPEEEQARAQRVTDNLRSWSLQTQRRITRRLSPGLMGSRALAAMIAMEMLEDLGNLPYEEHGITVVIARLIKAAAEEQAGYMARSEALMLGGKR